MSSAKQIPGSAADLVPLPSWDSDGTWRTFENHAYHAYIGNVELQKSAYDLDRYSDLIEISQPDLVIETGTRQGGSALWFEEQGLKVLTIDIDRDAGTQARRQSNTDRIEWLVGWSSVDTRLAFEVGERIQSGQRVMVSLDSDHHYQHVADEIRIWSSFVTPGCYLVIEDACFDMWVAKYPERARHGGHRIPELGGALPAIQDTFPLLSAKGFWRDTSVEGLHGISHSPVGWWRKDD